jgi:hypothetical protein
MAARRAKKVAMRLQDADAREKAKANVNLAKIALGERGAVWWDDGKPDLNRKLIQTTCYAGWYAKLASEMISGSI